jgi:hypothetical protein
MLSMKAAENCGNQQIDSTVMSTLLLTINAHPIVANRNAKLLPPVMSNRPIQSAITASETVPNDCKNGNPKKGILAVQMDVPEGLAVAFIANSPPNATIATVAMPDTVLRAISCSMASYILASTSSSCETLVALLCLMRLLLCAFHHSHAASITGIVGAHVPLLHCTFFNT